ncbi:hypothetical protein T11_300 [Trichinella zimbabwensis]|uniref:Uncharacterized protein n=1 Tax=Trichinella zimbabwensis TaxID=268475 RepID=A0A0V1GJZ7_9BILA|nr:hypothetical protein T11_300 [Trichinella zimbabwensis]
MIQRFCKYLDKYAVMKRATSLGCFGVFGENFFDKFLAFFVINR